jgi:hypothetical protein
MTEKGISDFDKESDALILLQTETTRVNLAVKPTDKEKPIPFVSYHICHHDETNPKPCVIIEKVMATKQAVII